MTATTFKGVNITRSNVVRVLEAFAALYADPNTYEGWLEKGSYLYAIDFEGKLYPPKHILSQVTSIPTTEFSGGEQTNRVFRGLGFTIVTK
jgi:5-methylcytosine-specific restriction protein A